MTRKMVILERADWSAWLDLIRPEAELLQPAPGGSLIVCGIHGQCVIQCNTRVMSYSAQVSLHAGETTQTPTGRIVGVTRRVRHEIGYCGIASLTEGVRAGQTQVRRGALACGSGQGVR